MKVDNAAEVQRLANALTRVQLMTPVEFRVLMQSGAERYIVPPAKAATPVLTGRLRDATRVVPSRYGVRLVNTASRGPRGRWVTNRYGNSIHWGRLTNPSLKSSLSPKHSNKVEGKQFIWRYARDNRPATFDAHLANGVRRLMERTI